ncbi:DUF3362 domain-containing protein, partial [Vibrio alfacsensis]|uniref:DUF3362 domain-containing protein n=1 Tax=Vibrio alfacsensis TaxID=1074311 RepID=UPI00406891E6
HDPANWPLIREALTSMGKQYLNGDKPGCLVPADDLDAKTPAQLRKSVQPSGNGKSTRSPKRRPR